VEGGGFALFEETLSIFA